MMLACGGERDADVFRRLVSQDTPQAQRDLPACRQLQSAALRGECQLVVAQGAAAAAGLPPETHCDQIDGDTWQSECWFQAAEAHSEDDPARAAALCARSGPFADHCAQHLWQQAIRRLTWNRGSAAFLDRRDEAQEILDAWAPHLAEGFDFEGRLWRRFYEGGFERSSRIALSKCDGLPEADTARCRAAGASLFSRRLQEMRHITPAMAALCALPEPTSAGAAATGVPEFNVEPAAELDAVVAKARETVCDDSGEAIVFERRVMAPSSGHQR